MSKRKQHKNKKLKATMEYLKVQRGLDRQVYFESGGELCRWRGVHTVQKNKKKEKARRKCRGRWDG
mgnify:CR=1 FL=1